MSRPVWARLSAPFPPSARAWALQELSPDRRRALVAPRLTAAAVRSRLDEAVSPDGWSCQLLPLGGAALVCNLTVEGVTRSAVAALPAGAVPGSELSSASALAEAALSLCAAQFGMAAGGASGWAPHDPETGDVLVEELEEAIDGPGAPVRPGEDAWLGTPVDGPSPAEAAAATAGSASAGALGERPETEPREDRPEAHQVIDRLVERLKEEGLGSQAARLVVRYGGYGRTPEESRELYGKLRSLLVGKVAVGS
ncbi:MAG TPA: hypothetical protein VF202_04590 [Trueperaceae bacterium]